MLSVPTNAHPQPQPLESAEPDEGEEAKVSDSQQGESRHSRHATPYSRRTEGEVTRMGERSRMHPEGHRERVPKWMASFRSRRRRASFIP
jgi:hypothetical protein